VEKHQNPRNAGTVRMMEGERDGDKTNTKIGEGLDRVTTVKREIIKSRRDIPTIDDPEKRSLLEINIIKLCLQRMKWDIINSQERKLKTVENGNELDDAIEDYKNYKAEFVNIKLPRVTTEAYIEGQLPATDISIDNEWWGTVHNDGLKDALALANSQAFKMLSERLSVLDVRVSEYVNIGWDKDDSDPRMTAESLGSEYSE